MKHASSFRLNSFQRSIAEHPILLLIVSSHAATTNTSPCGLGVVFQHPAKGKSALDGFNRKRLRKLWEENTRRYVGRGKDELIFFCFRGHWPEQECIEQPCSKARSEEIVSQYQTRKASETK